MTSYLSESEGWAIFLAFALSMIGIVWLATRPHQTRDEHLVAGRKVSTWPGAFSIAVSWIWAPAVFICGQKAYEQGMAGIFWFTFPNILCFFTFAPIALRLRRLMPLGYSMPDFVYSRYLGDRRSHLMFVTVTLGYELGAIIINVLAGGTLMHALAGINLTTGILAMTVVALSYAMWRAMPASIVTDFVQMSVILLIAILLVPWSVSRAGGWDVVGAGLAGTKGSTNVFDPWIAYTFGIPATLGLISGPIADQMFYQRVMSSRYENVVRTFIFGGLIFGVVPIVLSIFGFLAASPSVAAHLSVGDPQMVSVAVVQHFLPRWTLFAFAFMALCALSSTLDSAYIAIGSIFAVDIYTRYLKRDATDGQVIRASKGAMLAFAVLGTAIAMIPGIKLLWVFLIYGTLASSALVPTVLTLFWGRLTARGAFWAPFLSFIIGLPVSVYANFTQNEHMVVLAAVLSSVVGIIVCLIDGFTNRGSSFDFKPIVAAEAPRSSSA